MKFENLKLELLSAGKILQVSLNRPEKRNAFNADLIKELKDVFEGPARSQGEEYKNVRLVVLKGEGKAFCGGGDLNWMKAGLDLSEAENFEDCQFLTRMFLAMDRCPNPLLGIVHGYAIGGGVGLVSVCDHIIASEETIFSLSEVKLGLVPACIGPFVLGKIGYSNSRSLFISGERFEANKAKEIGLIHSVVSANELQSSQDRISKQIISGGQNAIASAKDLLAKLQVDLAAAPLEEALDFAAGKLAALRVSDEGQEGLKAFLEKRSPSWRE